MLKNKGQSYNFLIKEHSFFRNILVYYININQFIVFLIVNSLNPSSDYHLVLEYLGLNIQNIEIFYYIII